MAVVRPKKRLGQHFLRDQNTARKIVDSLDDSVQDVLEVGAGMGILTRYLLERKNLNIYVVEIDSDSVRYLTDHFPEIADRIYHADFLKWEPGCFTGDFNLIGNFPYNISSQIFFKILRLHRRIPQVVGMVQKEVAERISSGPGNKDYGILSVLLGAFYDIGYLFTVSEKVFFPAPKVKSAVIKLKHNNVYELPCREDLFITLVKSAFGQRRKMLRNSLKSFGFDIPSGFADKRPEQLSVSDFIELTCELGKHK
jgi:16S rRNA (adenine1518-N6/adenine1519-N6)-dimethyltransferase